MADEGSQGFAAELLRAGTTTGASIGGDPSLPEVDDGARRRLAAATLVTALAMALYTTLYATLWADVAHVPGRVMGIVSTIYLSGLTAWLYRGLRTRRQIVAAAISFHVILGLTTLVAEYWLLPELTARLAERPSWNAINILMVPALVPLGPWGILKATVALAMLNPVALVSLSSIQGVPLPPTPVMVSLLLPQFVCALLAWVPSKAMAALQRELARERRLGAYVLRERLGAGGMGEVWAASHRFLARPAAVKIVKPELLSNDLESAQRTLLRFEREAQVTAALESIHTVDLYDFGIARDGTFYCVMERLRGVDLQELVDRFGPLPPERATHLLVQVCDSLDEAHDAGLVHRDVKPANVFVGRRAQVHDFVKVLDFGLVKDRSASMAKGPEVALSIEGRIEGTPAYLSPEALQGDRPLDGRADLYAVGCLGFFLLTGRLVFEEKSLVGMAAAHLSTPPPAPSSKVATPIPAALDDALGRCLAKDPDDRPPSAGALGRQLRALGFERPWSQERAAAWWAEHLPDRR